MQIILISISKWAQFLKIFFTILEVSLKRNSKAQFVASTFIEKIMKICPNPSLKNSFTYQNIEASLTGRFLLPNYQGRVKRFNQSMVRDQENRDRYVIIERRPMNSVLDHNNSRFLLPNYKDDTTVYLSLQHTPTYSHIHTHSDSIHTYNPKGNT